MNELVQLGFDYSQVNEEQSSQLQAIYNRVLLRHMSTAYEDGKDLLEAKSIKDLPYKDFIAWANAMFGWSESSVNQKINVALNFGSTPTVGVIEDRALYLLSTKRVPESAREEAKERAASGEEITEEIARQIRDAHKEKEQAQAEVKRAHEQLWQTQEISQNRSIQLNEQIAKLRLEIEALTAKKSSGISPEAQEKINKLTEQRDNLSKKVEELGEEARKAALKRNEEEQERRIRQDWRKLTKDFQVAVVKMLSQLPSPIDVQVFEADDWERLSQAKELARRFIAECENLSRSPTMIVESGWNMAYATEP
jgi:DNA repair exonuclease SbcCD ATPase subunit